MSRNSPFSGIWENIIHHEDDELPEETRRLIIEYLFPKLKKLFADASATPVYFLTKGKTFKTAHLEGVEVSEKLLQPYFSISVNEKSF